jgi:tetrahydromethanopterin S-methyltransferase subunit D
MTKQTVLLTLAFVLAGAAAAHASGTGWSCRTCGWSNGTQLTGLATEKPVQSNMASAVILPTGEILNLH